MTNRTVSKTLSANDVGATGGHQGGILIPKSEAELLLFLPALDPKVKNPDAWIALAGRLSDDLSEIISEQPTQLPDLLRTVRGFTAEQLRKLREEAQRLKEEGE